MADIKKKEFARMVIVGNELQVFCIEKGEEKLEFSVNLKPFYWMNDADLEHNVFLSEDDLLFDGIAEDEVNKCYENINAEFMENFCSDVPHNVLRKLDENDVIIKTEKNQEDYLNELFNNAIKIALNLDSDWNEIK